LHQNESLVRRGRPVQCGVRRCQAGVATRWESAEGSIDRRRRAGSLHGHTENNASRFILGNLWASATFNLQHAFRAIRSMPVSSTPIAFLPSCRAQEENSTSTEGRWRLTRSPDRPSLHIPCATDDLHLVARALVRRGREDAVAILSLPEHGCGMRIQTLRKWPGERLRICCTMTRPGKSGGRALQQSFNASVPPVEAPMATPCGSREVIPGRQRGRDDSPRLVRALSPWRRLYFGDDVAGLLDGSIRNVQFWLRNISTAPG